MRVGFLNNQIDNRGTGNALYDYAHYNETLLGNESSIYTLSTENGSRDMLQKLLDRFGRVSAISNPYDISDVDVLYHIKYGNEDGFRTRDGIRYAVHAVFDATQPHGDRYAAISKWLSKDKVPFVPHIIQLPLVKESYREFHNIPKSATVFGRYGGRDTFDISWVWDTIEEILSKYENIWFIFANTEPALQHPRIIYREELITPITKSLFINTCDYMLHARHRGETFGIAVGEFASLGKPVLTYGLSGERAHLELLNNPYIYNNQFELYDLFKQLYAEKETFYGYTEFSPENVMKKFKEVFLD